ncbi:MAG: GSCFA domain-containing protein [Pseudomonadota bacterium]
MTHPYEALGPEAFWKTAVADAGPFGLSGLWSPKFSISPRDIIATAGSCFAQHIGNALTQRDYSWTDFEPAPPNINPESARRFGYGVFSFRTGNIYTPSMLLQWLELAYGLRPDCKEVWTQDGRYFDPLRPAIEPNGFATETEMIDARQETYAALRRAVEQSSVFVFTLGLTEHWVNADTGLEYALCPGTVAGAFDPQRHRFVNADNRSAFSALVQAIKLMRARNSNLRVLLTVSPVPLTATASGEHVLTATQYSKSVLRAVAGRATQRFAFVDYFPSFEIITHPVFRGMFFAPNMRSVVPEGVQTVMTHFFNDQTRVFPLRRRKRQRKDKTTSQPEKSFDLQCEEAMLGAFAK